MAATKRANYGKRPTLTGRANALTRGKGKKTGLKRITSTSSAASSFSKKQKSTYAKMNRQNTAKVAAKNLARSTTNAPRKAASYGPPRVTPQWSLFGGISDAIRRATGK